MLTGFNTDVEYDGVTYHVQTEDRGTSGRLIESLVYVKGEILASRRTSYQNLLEAGAELSAVKVLMEKQHFSLVESIRRGRIDALTENRTASESDTTITRAPLLSDPPKEGRGKAQKSLDEVIGDWLAAQATTEQAEVRVDGGDDLRFGQPFALTVHVLGRPGGDPVGDAEVTARFLSTEHRPLQLAAATTGAQGEALLAGVVPDVEKGTALVVVTMKVGGIREELKFLVHR